MWVKSIFRNVCVFWNNDVSITLNGHTIQRLQYISGFCQYNLCIYSHTCTYIITYKILGNAAVSGLIVQILKQSTILVETIVVSPDDWIKDQQNVAW